MAISSDNLRRILHSGLSFVRGVEVNRSTSALTLDHLIDEQIRTISRGETREMVDGRGSQYGKRPSKLDALDTLEKEIKEAAKAVRDAGEDEAKLAALGLDPDKAREEEP
jgi:siroheme synthase